MGISESMPTETKRVALSLYNRAVRSHTENPFRSEEVRTVEAKGPPRLFGTDSHIEYLLKGKTIGEASIISSEANTNHGMYRAAFIPGPHFLEAVKYAETPLIKITHRSGK